MFAYVDSATVSTEVYVYTGFTGLTIGQDYCLEFYYHMHGSDIHLLAATVDVMQPPLLQIENGRW